MYISNDIGCLLDCMCWIFKLFFVKKTLQKAVKFNIHHFERIRRLGSHWGYFSRPYCASVLLSLPWENVWPGLCDIDKCIYGILAQKCLTLSLKSDSDILDARMIYVLLTCRYVTLALPNSILAFVRRSYKVERLKSRSYFLHQPNKSKNTKIKGHFECILPNVRFKLDQTRRESTAEYRFYLHSGIQVIYAVWLGGYQDKCYFEMAMIVAKLAQITWPAGNVRILHSTDSKSEFQKTSHS